MDDKVDIKGYKIRPTYHITTLYIAKEKQKVNDPIYEHFEVGKIVDIPVRAVIFVPNKIMTAVCFPHAECANQFPHMTLLLGKWAPKMSNDALEASCGHEDQPFFMAYQAAESGTQGGSVFYMDALKVGRETCQAYFVILDNSITFEGINHLYFS